MTQQQPLTDEQINEIDARANAATKEPWTVSENYSDVLGPDGDMLASYWNPTSETRNGEFIAHAREDVPALVAEVRRLRSQRRFLIDQLARKDARSGEGDRALREFLAANPDGGEITERLTGTQQCGHDDYHDPHEWADRPGVWCPGHSHADEETHVVADGSDDPEHVDDCPGCEQEPPAAASGPQVAASEETNR